jgi:hypothetical protein
MMGFFQTIYWGRTKHVKIRVLALRGNFTKLEHVTGIKRDFHVWCRSLSQWNLPQYGT